MKKDISELAFMKSSAGLSAMALALALASFAGAAHAQTPVPPPGGAEEQAEDIDQKAEAEGRDSRDIVVTGTLLRGVAPAGSNTLEVSNQDVKLSGVTDSNALLTQLVPQAEGFMDLGRMQPGNGGNNAAGLTRVPVVRPSLRNLGDSFQGSGSPTLVLIDGHRVVPAGIEQSVVDIGAIPAGILDRTEIVLDGTSAVYGSDAVGGTINYIPRKRFDETRFSINYGAAADYYSVSTDLSTGWKWNTGGIGFGYSFGKNSDLLVEDREWTIPHNYLPGQNDRLTSLACDSNSHISFGTGVNQRNFLSTTLAEQANWCEPGKATVVQAIERHSAFLTFSQDLSDRVRFEVSGFYSQRLAVANGGPFTSALTVPSGNPYYPSHNITTGGFSGANQTVHFTWAPIYGNKAQRTETNYKMWQVSPEISVDLGGDWQVRLMGAYGKSHVTVDQVKMDSVLLNNRVRATSFATAINPYEITQTQNPALLDGLLWVDHRDGIHNFYQANAIVDGPLFTMPGGEVRVALGAEWNKTSFRRRVTDQNTFVVSPFTSASVINKAVFGEVNIPFVSSQNSSPLIHALRLSVSGRYDHYDNTGGTFNPKIAATYEPVEWISIRGSWGKSFRAPNAVDRLGSSANVLQCSSNADVAFCRNIGAFFAVPTGMDLATDRPNVLLSLAGTAANVKPETSTNWSVGMDLRPPFIEGLQINANYFKIDFRNQIRFPPNNVNDVLAGAPHLVILQPDASEILAFAQGAPGGNVLAQQVIDAGYNVLYTFDSSITNLASAQVSGVDATVRYVRPTGFGSIDLAFNGTWQLTNKAQATQLAPVVDVLRQGTPIFRMSATAGATIGNFRAQVTFQHRSGYAVDPAVTRDPAQTHIDSYQLWNAAFRYAVNGESAFTKDLAFSLVINNIFNSAPPINRTSTGSTTNGSTLGRFIQFGIEKAF